jgi:uncharacterized RDD family membrane protein YckC
MTDPVHLARLRVAAWLIDLLLVVGLGGLLNGLGWLFGAAYWLVRDGLWTGQSVGKRVMGLRVVVDREPPRCTFTDSMIRNVLWLVPILQVVVGFTGLYHLLHDPRGRHWGDRLAKTQVVGA